jgi:hypothetical protein
MSFIVEVDRFVNPIDKIKPVAIEKIVTLSVRSCKMFVRQKRGEKPFRAAARHFVAADFGAVKFISQSAPM